MTRMRVVVATAAVAVLAVGCGGGKSKASLSPGYVKRANALCDDWTKALAALGPNPPAGDVVQTERYTRKVLDVDESFTPRFKDLPATPEERKILASIYASFDTINAAEAAVINSAQRGDRVGIQTYQQKVIDETLSVNARLRALRLTVCSG